MTVCGLVCTSDAADVGLGVDVGGRRDVCMRMWWCVGVCYRCIVDVCRLLCGGVAA